MNEEQLIAKLLKVLEENILPLTKIEVKRGNKIFGAAILKKSDLNLVVAGTNQETHNPLWHGEISCLNSYWALPKNKRVPTKDCIFFSTHEPCSLCLSAITWSGFDNFYYFFSNRINFCLFCFLFCIFHRIFFGLLLIKKNKDGTIYWRELWLSEKQKCQCNLKQSTRK